MKLQPSASKNCRPICSLISIERRKPRSTGESTLFLWVWAIRIIPPRRTSSKPARTRWPARAIINIPSARA